MTTTQAVKRWVIGNWKLNPASLDDAKVLAQTLKHTTFEYHRDKLSLAVAPSFVHIGVVCDILADVCAVGVQDVSAYGSSIGAFTGDVSAVQAMQVGATFALIGHSERRSYHHENNAILAKKIINAHQANLTAVLCVGESQDDYQAGKTLSVLDEQLAVLGDCQAYLAKTSNLNPLIVAYEPVWAIGTGLVPTLAEIEKAHQHIKLVVKDYLDCQVSVLYGGSVNADNAKMFAGSAWVDGVLVGGASLKAESFWAIAKHFV